ncbi:hypothetical protein TNIN_467341 [Trichonephila inaurata madagascariensis]|uniref:Uncharacterized protein n=1 Tax=Trichonephila inaurata madagascariensis TaxID=2747483 RepID=A0A8X6I685_9ARAC|nr:hypothetical protein TNIN_467341 [Trichonephila inaurata madagascariensis]
MIWPVLPFFKFIGTPKNKSVRPWGTLGPWAHPEAPGGDRAPFALTPGMTFGDSPACRFAGRCSAAMPVGGTKFLPNYEIHDYVVSPTIDLNASAF